MLNASIVKLDILEKKKKMVSVLLALKSKELSVLSANLAAGLQRFDIHILQLGMHVKDGTLSLFNDSYPI